MRNWTYLLYLIILAVNCENDKGEWKEVKIKQGPVRGYRDSTGELWTFYNIPYATAPTGKHKFKAPLPPPTWTEPFDAVDKSIVCPQSYADFLIKGRIMKENCLIANVYVPDTQKENLSVAVYVNSFGFQAGFGDWLKMKNLMKHKDMIIVNFNFRLGIHGFLCLGTDDVPGNAGMKDQVTMLHWVQQNIASFGGNPNDVTIIGGNSGSASVDLLMISKQAEGLFHKVVPEGVSSLAAFSVQTDPLQIAIEHAKKLNFTNFDDIFDLEEFYKNLPYQTLVADSFMFNVDFTFTFSPCVERNRAGAFLTKSPLSILKSGEYKKVPLLYGFANMEGLVYKYVFDLFKDRMTENFSDFLTPDLKFESEDEKQLLAMSIKQFYFDDHPVSISNFFSCIDFFSDIFTLQSLMWTVKLHLEAGHDKVYLYEYNFDYEDTSDETKWGASHYALSFDISDGYNLAITAEDDISEEFKKMKSILREMWHNFITTGKPVPEGSSLPTWPPVRVNNSPYMSIGEEVELRDEIYEYERFTFWQNIYQQYYKEPIQPPRLPFKSHNDL